MAPGRPSTIVAALRDIPDGSAYDFVVIGAGAAGLTAAVFAGLSGARVLIVEHSGLIGGTSALTAGTLWLPGAYAADGRSPEEDRLTAGHYLKHAIGSDRLAPLRERFLDEGAEAIALLERRTCVSFIHRDRHPDYLGAVSGAAVSGRAIEIADFDGRVLGRDLRLLRPPLRNFTILGGLAPNRDEARRYSVIAARPASPAGVVNAFRALPRVSRHLADLLARRRSSRLTLGNALVGRLLASLMQLGTARLVLNAQPVTMTRGESGIDTVLVSDGQSERTIRVTRGVICATGGFTRGSRRKTVLDGLPLEWSAVADDARGTAHSLLESVGAVFERQGTDAFWAPVSLPPGPAGCPEPYPHFALDRGKPGFVIVDRQGRRYLNEAEPYHVLGEKMLAHADAGAPSFLIADETAVRRFGIGAVRPGGWGRRRRLRDGYLIRGRSLDELGDLLDLPPGALTETIERFNSFAERGEDPDFGRGTDPYQRGLGHPGHRPNPSLGAVARAPFYAIRIYPGDIGSASGFVTDEHARALDADGRPIGRLYALGGDMRSIMEGRYPGPGITLGPAVVFAQLAVRDAMGGRP